jgi:hypothetical protein
VIRHFKGFFLIVGHKDKGNAGLALQGAKFAPHGLP